MTSFIIFLIFFPSISFIINKNNAELIFKKLTIQVTTLCRHNKELMSEFKCIFYINFFVSFQLQLELLPLFLLFTLVLFLIFLHFDTASLITMIKLHDPFICN
jgi:hypothetical protein